MEKNKARNYESHHKSYLPMVLLCIAVLAGVFFLSRSDAQGSWYWLLILLCPLAHLWMMRDMHGHGAVKGHKRKGGCH